MKKIILISILTLLTYQIKAQKEVNWLSFEDAIALNKKMPKPILIDIYTDWCGYCTKMDIETYTNKTIIEYINNNYYAVKLDGEGKEDIIFKDHTFKFEKQGRNGYHQLSASLMNGRLSYPTTVILSKKEDLLDRIPGYLDTKSLEKILVYFAEGHYENKKWKDFSKNFESNL